MATTTLIVLLFAATERNSPALQGKLTCIDELDHGPSSTGTLLVLWSQIRSVRLENVSVYSDGDVRTRVQLRSDRGLRDCRAKLSPARLATFRSELEASAVCRVRPPRSVFGDSNGVFVDLGGGRKCDLRLPASQWQRTRATRMVQQAIDRLKQDICGGPCAEPGPPAEPFKLIEDANRVSPAFRHLYRKPGGGQAPDAGPPKKP